MTFPPAEPPNGAAPQKTNGFAITSLITGIIGCTALLGVIFGFVALSQIRTRGDRGRGMAIAGIVIGFVWMVGSLIAYFLIPSAPAAPSGAEPKPSPTKTTPHALEVSDIKPGQCFNDSTNGNNGESSVQKLTIVACGSPHDAQALATFRFQRGAWPGDRALTKAAGHQCRKRAGRHISRDPASRILSLSWYLPTKQSWGLTGGGDRGVLCVVTHAKEGKKLTRRIR